MKLEAAEKAVKIHKELSELVLYAGVGPKVWADVVHNLATKRMSRIEFITAFLESLRSKEWADMNTIWCNTNTTPEMWHNYKILFDKPVLIEQKQMRVASNAMKDRMKKWKEELRDRIMKEKEGLIVEPFKEEQKPDEDYIAEAKALDDAETIAPT